MAELKETSLDTFASDVLNADLPVLVDFGAVWCGPCKQLDPLVEQLAADWSGKVLFFKVDVDHNPDLAMQFSVMGVPTLMLFKDGVPVERMTGYKPKDKIIQIFNDHL